jgi:CRISPR-associated protein Csm3
MASLKLLKYIIVNGKITCLTGLRIGGTKDDIEIGGMDNPIIRDPRTRRPYIPGSSLKGKLRSTLEYREGRIGDRGEPCGCGRPDCIVCKLFGPHKNTRHELGPTRIIVRDAHIVLGEDENPDTWIEVKSETAIDRRTGIAGSGSLRQNERVIPGAVFAFEISVRVFDGDNERQFLDNLRDSMDRIEKDYLGASGTRGYGKVKFEVSSPSNWLAGA